MSDICDSNKLKHRFRGYFPIVIDVETAGFNANTDAFSVASTWKGRVDPGKDPLISLETRSLFSTLRSAMATFAPAKLCGNYWNPKLRCQLMEAFCGQNLLTKTKLASN